MRGVGERGHKKRKRHCFIAFVVVMDEWMV